MRNPELDRWIRSGKVAAIKAFSDWDLKRRGYIGEMRPTLVDQFLAQRFAEPTTPTVGDPIDGARQGTATVNTTGTGDHQVGVPQ